MRTLTASRRSTVATTVGLVVSLSLVACSRAENVACSLKQFHGELVAENGRPLLKATQNDATWEQGASTVLLDWPDGWTIRPTDGGQLEVLDANGSVRVRTGTPVVLLPPYEVGGYRYSGGEFRVCDADPYEVAGGSG